MTFRTFSPSLMLTLATIIKSWWLEPRCGLYPRPPGHWVQTSGYRAPTQTLDLKATPALVTVPERGLGPLGMEPSVGGIEEDREAGFLGLHVRTNSRL